MPQPKSPVAYLDLAEAANIALERGKVAIPCTTKGSAAAYRFRFYAMRKREQGLDNHIYNNLAVKIEQRGEDWLCIIQTGDVSHLGLIDPDTGEKL